MTTRYVQPGEVIDYTAGADVAAGAVVLMTKRIGVALGAIASGATGSVQVTGVFTIKKKTTDDVAQGALLYWDATNSELTTTATSNTLAGYAFAAAGTSATSVNIKLNA